MRDAAVHRRAWRDEVLPQVVAELGAARPAWTASGPSEGIVQQAAAQFARVRLEAGSAVGDRMNHPDDKPTIGLLLCKSKNKVVVEYALRDVAKPIGVAQWETMLVESLPEELKGSLPTVAQIEAELGGEHG